jgi:hypothetical protein
LLNDKWVIDEIKQEIKRINDLILQFKLLEKQEQANSKQISRRKEIIKICAEINEI